MKPSLRGLYGVIEEANFLKKQLQLSRIRTVLQFHVTSKPRKRNENGRVCDRDCSFCTACFVPWRGKFEVQSLVGRVCLNHSDHNVSYMGEGRCAGLIPAM